MKEESIEDAPPPLPADEPPPEVFRAQNSELNDTGSELEVRNDESDKDHKGGGVAGGHTPESIARLPPKLRQRLVQRGVLKEQDVNLALQMAQGGGSHAQPAKAETGVTQKPITGAVVKASGPPPPSFDALAAQARVSADLARLAAAKAFPDTKAMLVPGAAASPISAPPPAKQVYLSAPVLGQDVQKRPLGAEEASEAKRFKAQADSVATAQSEQATAVPQVSESNVGAKASPPGPPLPAGWVRVPHEGDHYFWNTQTNEVTWEHPVEARLKGEKEKKPKFKEEHKVLWTDLGKIIGRQGMNLKVIKASIGCDIHIPKQESKEDRTKDGKGGKNGKGGKDAKGKSKGKRDAEGNKVGRGIGDGSTKLKDDQFCTVTVTGDTALKANGGKRCLQIMLGYGRNVERALADLGVEAKMPSLEEMTDGKSKKKDDIDPMDPASYSDAPVGTWSKGLKKPGQKAPGGASLPRDSKSANAERF